MLFDPKDGPIDIPKAVTYGDVAHYCQSVMGSISMLDLQVTGEHRLQGGPPPAVEQVCALNSLKDAGCDLIEHIRADSGCDPREMTASQLDRPLSPSAQALYDIMIERQYALQRLTGQPEGPVPVLI